jgi:hypothetical protein
LHHATVGAEGNLQLEKVFVVELVWEKKAVAIGILPNGRNGSTGCSQINSFIEKLEWVRL